MPDKNNSIEARIESLRARYVESLGDRFSELNQAYVVLLEDNVGLQQIQRLEMLSHTLCGSAGSFGFGNIAAYCKRIERLCQALMSQLVDNAEIINEITRTISLLEESILDPRITEHDTLLELRGNSHPRCKEKLVYLLDDEKTLSEYLGAIIESAGYTVACFQGVDAFLDAVQQQAPEIMILDIAVNQDNGTEVLKFLYSQLPGHIPSLVISASSDFKTRLSAVRAGADAFLAKPLDANDVIDSLDCLVSDQITEPYRVLIVDDVEAMSSYYRIVLERGGIQCQSISRPEETLDVLGQFNPEVVLMDLHMEGCRADELAKLIHQDKKYFDIPVVYLSSESDLKQPLSALRITGDGLLKKPIRPSELIEAISIRARRYRQSRKMMHQSQAHESWQFDVATEALS
jgi:DNA-binding response OmpR family regulator/HPt (histidine-containing phosphotransfer) domain-containing protein